MFKDLFSEIKDNLNESDWIKIKLNALMALLSFVFLVSGICATTIAHCFSLIPLIVFGVIIAVLGLVGIISFVIGIFEIVHQSL